MEHVHDAFLDIHLELGNIGLPMMEPVMFAKDGVNAERAKVRYILAQDRPLVMVEVHGVKWLENRVGQIDLHVTHV